MKKYLGKIFLLRNLNDINDAIKLGQVYVLLLLSLFLLVSCSSSPSNKDAHTLVYAAGQLGTVRDDGCIVLYLYPSESLIWMDIPTSHESVNGILKSNRDYYKDTAAEEYLYDPHGTHFFYFTGEFIDNYKIYENDSSMRIGITESREKLYFKPSGGRSIVVKLVGKVNP